MPSKHLDNACILNQFGGRDRNDLNQILPSSDVDFDADLTSFSPYVSEMQLPDYVNEYKNNFSVITLNCQSVKSKFDKIRSFLQDMMHEKQIHFSVIFLQETWLKPSEDFDDVIASFSLPGYKKPIGIPASSSSHGGLLCYVEESLDVTIVKEYKNSNVWEAIFLKINGSSIKPKLVGNVYRPPRQNNNNASIDKFLEEFIPVITDLSGKYKSVVLSGDFNIDLLKIMEREKYALYLDQILALGFVPKITLPTRFAKHSASLLDHIFVKLPDVQETTLSGILFSALSDHLAAFVYIQEKLVRIKVKNLSWLPNKMRR